MKRKKIYNAIVTVVSALYLGIFIIAFVRSRLSNQSFDFFGIDGVSLIGAMFSLVQLLFSKRNWVSTKINQIIISNKIVSYQLSISLENTAWSIPQIIDFFEGSLKNYFGIDELERRPTSSLKSARYSIIYKKLGITLECQRIRGYSPYEELEEDESDDSCNYMLRISGQGKFGRLGTNKKDVVYFSSLIRLLSNQCFMDAEFLQNIHIGGIEIIINKIGSQITMDGLFNEELPEINTYCVQRDDPSSDIEFELTQDGIKWSTINAKELFEGAEELTDLLCKIA